jgi:hypothetical protein
MVGEKLQEQKVEKIRSILVQQPLSKQNNALCFIEGDCMPHETAGFGLLALLQNFLKKKVEFTISSLTSYLRSRLPENTTTFSRTCSIRMTSSM